MDRHQSSNIQQHSALLRHEETIPGEDDGAVRFDDLIEKFRVIFVGTSDWTVDAWTTFPGKWRSTKEKGTILIES